MIDIQTIPLRERKHAQTKIALAREFMERLKTKRLAEISVKEVCETIPISEVTFYNYFPEKTDIFIYLMQLWHTEILWKLAQWEKDKSNIEIIEAWFDFACLEITSYAGALNEVLSFVVQQQEITFSPMSVAEKILAFPDCDGIELFDVRGIHSKNDSMLKPYLEKAIKSGELPPQTDLEEVDRMLDTIFLGGMMTLYCNSEGVLRSTYQKMLRFLWQGLRAEHDALTQKKNRSSFSQGDCHVKSGQCNLNTYVM
ncbi:transcription activator, AraC family [Candidatus Moduliflexus flocculans]|uniref:Transcription activator, AraC family n=1 Tax=Candidatus Moduliflexus flocculans TaxID=1499966 RepID=A0A0S6VPH5_9BACT|nr:transcription activator, AraC family [Candidatus Moduliflexus flocculans]